MLSLDHPDEDIVQFFQTPSAGAGNSATMPLSRY
jgi:hypothetical protein